MVKMDFNALSKIMKDAGVAGAGGAGFPSYAKLNKAADTIILNCAECEPLLKLHRQVLQFHAEEILDALSVIAETVEATKVIIAVKPSYKEAIAAVNKYISNYPNTEIGLLPEIYPAGDEVITIYETTGRVVPPGKIPIAVGVTVFNVETALNVARALRESAPVTYKYITICGEVRNPVTLKAPLGMTYGEIIELAGGATVENPVLIAGGPMTGSIAHKNDVVTKTSNAILVMPEHQYIVAKRLTPLSIDMKRAMSVCCNCRMCTDLCSRNLLGHPIDPQRFMQVATSGVATDTKPYIGTFFCSACGLCEMYACGQGLNPRTMISATKGMLRKNGIKIPDDIVADKVSSTREYRKVPMERLTARLGLEKYNLPAPLSEELVGTKRVKIMLSQSIGAPAVAAVKAGDTVKAGDVVGAPAENALSLPVHASVNGVVAEVTDKYVLIEAK